MQRLLIVDDEPHIVEGLFEALQNTDDLELDIFKAYSSYEALDLLGKARIDIAVTDIKMPGMDGIELLKQIKNKWPECRVIMLSGYSNFEYIYNSLQQMSVKYILKSEGFSTIIGTIRQTYFDIENSRKFDNLFHITNQEIKLVSSLVQKEYLSELIKRKSLTVSSEQFELYEIPLDAASDVMLVLGRMDYGQKNLSYLEITQLLYGVRVIAQRHLESAARLVHITSEKNYLIWFIQPAIPNFTEDDWKNLTIFINGTLETIQSVCKETLDVKLSFAMDNKPVNWADVSEQYYQLSYAFEQWGRSSEFILNDIENFGYNNSSAYAYAYAEFRSNLNQISLLQDYLEAEYKEKYFTLLTEITETLSSVDSKSNSSAIQLYFSVALMLLEYINKYKLVEKIASKIGLYKLMRTDDNLTWKDESEYLHKLSHIIFDIISNKEENLIKSVVGKIENYINENISKDLSLVKISEFAHFNPSYLSRLFKQLTGINISEYINTVRLKKAEEFLTDEKMKIHTVASLVGYESSKNFARFFKKMTNMTPQEYRDVMINKKN